MDYDISFNFRDDADILLSLGMLQDTFGLSNFVLWRPSGALLRLELASGPDATGKINVNVELLGQEFIDSFGEDKWILEGHYHPTRNCLLVGANRASKTFNSKKELLDAIKPFGPPSKISKLVKEASFSTLVRITEGNSTETGGFETFFTPETKTTTLQASEEVQVDGVEFVLNLVVSKVHQGLAYHLEVCFDMSERRDKILELLRGNDYFLMQGSHSKN